MGDCGSNVQQSLDAQRGPDPAFPPTDQEKEISVLVTGFGPFRDTQVNASYLVASSLPSSFTFSSSSPDESSESSIPTPRRVSIHALPSPIPVAYSFVRTEIPTVLDEYAERHGGCWPDLIIHIGIAATRGYYSVETNARRDSYSISDVDGKYAYEDGEKLWKELNLPPVLRPGSSDVATVTTTVPSKATRTYPYPPDNDFLETWKSFAPKDMDLRVSNDAGRYLCEFIFYTSLARAYLERRDRSVVFLHVPASHDDHDIEQGKQAALALIKALVTCWVDRKK